VRRGYYPKGRGEVLVNVHPVKALKSIKLVDAGEVIAVKGISHSSNLPRHIVERMARSAGELLGRYKPNIEHECGKGLSQGCGITLWAELSNSFLGSSAIGELGKPAEKVGAEAGGDMIKEIESKVPLDKYMGDQIIPYMALANGRSTIKIRELTDHLKTNIYITEKILGNKFDIAEDEHYIISTKGLGFKSNESS
jgi:RNA 3'-terminal phosphate cyclase (ATP)